MKIKDFNFNEIDWKIGFSSGKNGYYKDEKGIVYHFSKGFLHSINDKPAIELGVEKHWYKNGKKHRETGPASEYKNSQVKYVIDGVHITEKEFVEWQITNIYSKLAKTKKNKRIKL